ncbi:hypothetical protein AAL_00983 [Moelleriella libera RCEF 2490]|uniref:Uncharacterized protein n=1 Tax=Moelleriella libera RCEF 2490 TaxID=1081109 RepID=A0A166VCP1_9HYPO|nr:hypothetical protein AAL_00983 [Moelleriella libera RCEF 2490]
MGLQGPGTIEVVGADADNEGIQAMPITRDASITASILTTQTRTAPGCGDPPAITLQTEEPISDIVRESLTISPSESGENGKAGLLYESRADEAPESSASSHAAWTAVVIMMFIALQTVCMVL